MSPTDYLLGVLGQGPHTEMALTAKLLSRGHAYEQAIILVKNAIVTLVQGGRIEMCGPSVYRLPLSVPMEPDQREKTTRKTVRPLSGYDKLVAEAKEREGIK